MLVDFTKEEFNDLIYAAREAQIRFTRERSRLRAGEVDTRSRQWAEDELNDLDRHHGHRRVFNPESFRQAFYQSGYNIDYFGGYWLKPVSNSQIEANWTAEMLEAFMKLGERYPDIAGEIYVVASHK